MYKIIFYKTFKKFLQQLFYHMPLQRLLRIPAILRFTYLDQKMKLSIVLKFLNYIKLYSSVLEVDVLIVAWKSYKDPNCENCDLQKKPILNNQINLNLYYHHS